jgi:DNA-binding MarR family transcriptional regulator
VSTDPPVGYGRPHVGIKLRQAYETFIGQVFERLAEQGFDDMRPAHAQVFQNLKEEGIRLTDLARAAGISPQSMGALVDDLERLGYVERTGDPSDRRAALIRPTERGSAEVRAAREVIASLERRWARTVGEERFSALVETLDELNGDAEAAGRP